MIRDQYNGGLVVKTGKCAETGRDMGVTLNYVEVDGSPFFDPRPLAKALGYEVFRPHTLNESCIQEATVAFQKP